jgi:YidC/Oxa1 family membrane protein insertase
MIQLAAVLHAASTTATTVAKSSGSGGSILDPIAKPLGWVLAAVYSVIPDYGVAIIGLSILWMLIISPLTLKSTRSMLAMQKLQPELKKLQERHKSDKQAFAQAQMDLFREHNVSPFGSCLPMLLPLPVFFALFRVIDGLSHTVKVNGVVTAAPKYLDPGTKMYHAIVAAHGHLEAFGMDLSKGALSPHGSVLSAAPYWITLVVMGFTSYMQSAMMMNRNQTAANANPQMKMMKYLAPLFAVVSIRFPAGVVVYYATSNICRILQQDAMYRFDPKVKVLVTQEVQEVEELTQEIDEREKNRPGYTPPRGAKAPPTPPAKSSPGKSPPGKAGRGPDESGGRSRFRNLLAAAAEQQRAQQNKGDGNGNGDGKSAGNGDGKTGGNGTGRASSNGSGNATNGGSGSGRSGTGTGAGTGRNGGNGTGRNGGSAAGGAARNGGSQGNRGRPTNRTNRKRRGR